MTTKNFMAKKTIIVPPNHHKISNSFNITFAFDFFIRSAKAFEFCREFMYLPSVRPRGANKKFKRL